MIDPLDFLTRACATSPDHSLTVRALAITVYLAKRRTQVLSRVMADDLNLPKPTVSRLTRHLQNIGFIVKDRTGKDKRDCFLLATDTGREFVRAITASDVKAAA